MLNHWRQKLSEDSLFYKPLVFDITIVLVIKMILLVLLWQFAFKPLKPAETPNIDSQFLSTTIVTNTKEINHD